MKKQIFTIISVLFLVSLISADNVEWITPVSNPVSTSIQTIIINGSAIGNCPNGYVQNLTGTSIECVLAPDLSIYYLKSNPANYYNSSTLQNVSQLNNNLNFINESITNLTNVALTNKTNNFTIGQIITGGLNVSNSSIIGDNQIPIVNGSVFFTVGQNVVNPISAIGSRNYNIMQISPNMNQLVNRDGLTSNWAYIQSLALEYNVTSNGTFDGIVGIEYDPLLNGTETLTDGVYGFSTNFRMGGGYSGTIDDFYSGDYMTGGNVTSHAGYWFSSGGGNAHAINTYAFRTDDTASSYNSTNNYAFYSLLNKRTDAKNNTWGLYMIGTAPNYFNGDINFSKDFYATNSKFYYNSTTGNLNLTGGINMSGNLNLNNGNITVNNLNVTGNFNPTNVNASGYGRFDGGITVGVANNSNYSFYTVLKNTSTIGINIDGTTNPLTLSSNSYSGISNTRTINTPAESGTVNDYGITNTLTDNHNKSGSGFISSNGAVGITNTITSNGYWNVSAAGIVDNIYGLYNTVTKSAVTQTSAGYGFLSYGVYNSLTNTLNYNGGAGNNATDTEYGTFNGISSYPTLASGNITRNIYGSYNSINSNAVGKTTTYEYYGKKIDSGGTDWIFYADGTVGNNFLGGNNMKTYFGNSQASSITYNGTDMLINPKEVGSGKIYLQGQVNAIGNYSVGGIQGITASGTTCTITAITGGIITGATCV